MSYPRRQQTAGRTVRERVVVPQGHKHCPGCGEVKSVEDFHRAVRQSGGRASYCKPCKRSRDEERRLQREYGLTSAQVAALVEQQNGLCGLCRERPARHIDHDHATGVVRAVLCFACNSGLGQFGDRTDLLLRAVEYLRGSTHQRSRVAHGAYRLTAPRPRQDAGEAAVRGRAVEALASALSEVSLPRVPPPGRAH